MNATNTKKSQRRATEISGLKICVGAAMIVGTLGGCSTDLNSRMTIGATQELPGLDPAGATEDLSDFEATTRLDRGGWAPVEYRVPVDGTVHGPLLKTSTRFSDDNARAHGLYPTEETVLQLGGDPWDEAMRGFGEPGRALVDLAVLPVRWILSPPWEKTQSPSMYKRWHSGEWLAGPVPEGEADADGGS